MQNMILHKSVELILDRSLGETNVKPTMSGDI